MRASLAEVLKQIPEGMALSDVPAVEFSGVAIDSRRVQPGDLFIAMHGSSTDGHEYIQQALNAGAAAAIGERPPASVPQPYAQVRSSREAVSWIAAAFYGWPGRHLRVVGVTGTDGKTTTATLIHQILTTAGLKAGLISTVNAVIGSEQVDTGFHVTTPDAPDVQRYMAQMVEAGMTDVVLETTSHGWAQHRVDACEFDIGVVTNITHEHLDEHGDFESYRAAKARLITSLGRTSRKTHGTSPIAVLNRDDGSFEYLVSRAATTVISYGLTDKADVQAREIDLGPDGGSYVVAGKGLRIAIQSPLPGLYNVSNSLAAICATTLGLGVSAETAARAVSQAPAIPGRMESIDMGQPFSAIVDFAHTPNALKVALETARRWRDGSQRSGRIIAVFGSAGLRDRAKRRMMAAISAELADITILTAEDPRTESLSAILAEMAASATAQGGTENATFWRIPDRGEAIRFAVGLARPGDIVLACGKGHEQSMCFGAVEHPWDDRTAMRAALAELLRVPGPVMPYLPTRDQLEAAWLG